jgi:hypothetical protein
VFSELRRELIRLANRERFTAEDVTDLIDLAEHLNGLIETKEDRELMTAEHVLDFWKESFDEPQG